MGKIAHLKRAIDGAKRRVYQGSPHKYDGKLDHSKIGTGEGAQAYGYGHYLAENPDVAGTYRNVNTEMLIDGKPFDDMRASGFDGLDELAVLALRARNGNVDEAIKYAESSIDKGIADQLRKFDRSRLKVNEGHLYEFGLPESAIDNMLDWDAPLSEQSESVKASLRTIDDDYIKRALAGPVEKDGGDYWEYMGNTYNSRSEALEDSTPYTLLHGANPKRLSGLLSDAGIPGIKYHDGMSRAAGEGTRNFVIFPGNEDMVKAVSRNGEKLSAAALAPLAGIGLMGTFSEDSQAGVGGTIKAAGKALDMSQAARMKRAKEQGFDTDTVYYHGTNEDFDAFDPEMSRENGEVFMSSSPEVASDFAVYRGTWQDANVMPLHARGDFLEIDADYGRETIREIEERAEKLFGDIKYGETIRDYAKRKGYGGIKFNSVVDDTGGPNIAKPSNVLMVYDPSNIRSINAAFDPAKKDSANLLASLGGAGVLGAAALSPEDARAAELDAIALYGEPERGWRPTEKRNKWKQFKQQYVEPLGTIASSLASLPVSGLEGLGALAQGYGIDDAVGAMERRQEAMTYIPESEAGRQSLYDLGRAMEILGEVPPVRAAVDAIDQGADAAYHYGSKIHPKVGAALGATVKTLPEVVF